MEDFLKYYNDALRIAKRLTKDYTLAEDMVQDIFLKIIRNGIEIDGEKNYKGYLNIAIRHKYYSHLHKKKLGKHKGINVELDAAYNLPDNVMDLDLGDTLTKAIGSTKAELTLPLMLHVVHDYNYEEIAKILDIPLGTVRSRIHLAKKELKQKMAA
jgi:RNA polymerase sigma factor (sigma-70 family)